MQTKTSLSGLKQAPREQYKKFDTFMLSQGFDRSHADHFLYTRKDIDDSPIILVLYVDDMFLARKRKTSLDALKDQLKSICSMKYLGAYSGHENQWKQKGQFVVFSQEKYIQKVLNIFNMVEAKSLGVPFPFIS